MTDISHTLAAKSDQLNALDLAGSEPVITIRKVDVRENQDQPVWIYYSGDNNKPWKPSLGMRRILAGAWGTDSKNWIGKSARIFCEPSVRYAGKSVGGVQVRALSDIPAAGMHFTLAKSRTERVPFFVECLVVETKEYPHELFLERLPAMTKFMTEGKYTLAQVIARAQQTGALSDEQIELLENAAPIDDKTENENENETEQEQQQ